MRAGCCLLSVVRCPVSRDREERKRKRKRREYREGTETETGTAATVGESRGRRASRVSTVRCLPWCVSCVCVCVLDACWALLDTGLSLSLVPARSLYFHISTAHTQPF